MNFPEGPGPARPVAGRRGRGRPLVTASGNGRNIGAWLFWSPDFDTGVSPFLPKRG